MPPRYDLTPAAKADLREIWLYTAEQWGEQQADRYLQELEQCCERLVDHPMLGKARHDLRAGTAASSKTVTLLSIGIIWVG